MGIISINTKFDLPHFTVEEAPNNTRQFKDIPVQVLTKMKRFAIIALCVAAAALSVSAGESLSTSFLIRVPSGCFAVIVPAISNYDLPYKNVVASPILATQFFQGSDETSVNDRVSSSTS